MSPFFIARYGLPSIEIQWIPQSIELRARIIYLRARSKAASLDYANKTQHQCKNHESN